MNDLFNPAADRLVAFSSFECISWDSDSYVGEV